MELVSINMDNIKTTLFYQCNPLISGLHNHMGIEVPPNNLGLKTKWLLKAVDFSVRGERMFPCSFNIAVCKKSTRGETYTSLYRSSKIVMPKTKNSIHVNYDKHLTFQTGQYLLSDVVQFDRGSSNWTAYLTFEEHYDENGCCADRIQNLPLKLHSRDAINHVIMCEDI